MLLCGMNKDLNPISNNGNGGFQELLIEIRELRNRNSKEVLNLTEACDFLRISKSQMYKLTSARRIPFYRPTGKLIYFKRSELIDWALTNKLNPIK